MRSIDSDGQGSASIASMIPTFESRRTLNIPTTHQDRPGSAEVPYKAGMAMNTRHQPTVRALLVMLILALFQVPTTQATEEKAEFADFSELDLEELLDRVVVTASKRSQKISETPAAATLITAEQIAASGAASIPELLQGVVGLDVIMTTGSSFDVCARALNKLGSNSMLVLVDGRSVYADFYGITLWEYLQVPLQAIKAIEVIRGPGSAMYGANAFAGVINIITFESDEIQDHSVRTSYSNLGRGASSLLLARDLGAFHWRVALGFDQNRNWKQDLAEGEIAHGEARLGWEFTGGSQLDLSFGGSSGESLHYPSDTSVWMEGQDQYLRFDYSRGGMELRGFWNRLDLDLVPDSNSGLDEVSTLKSNVFDLELHQSLSLGSHEVLLGANYRHNLADWSLGIHDTEIDILAAFVYDEWRLTDPLLLSFGLRYDHHPLVGGNVAPRGGLVYQLGPRHAFRASYGIAYRNPSLLETYWYTEIPGPLGIGQIIRGNRDLQPETIHAIEIGYQGLLRDWLFVSGAVFSNQLREMIGMGVYGTYSSPPAPVEGIPSEIAFLNLNDWNQIGGEVSLEAKLANWLAVRASYSWVNTVDASSDADIRQAPNHIAGLDLDFTGIAGHQINLNTRYKSETTWTYGSLSEAPLLGSGDERLLVNLRWRIRFAGHLEQIVIGVDNIADERIRDHPLAIEQRRRIFSSLTVGF